MRITVIGGSGYLGRRAVEALRLLGGHEVVVASRSGVVPLDVTRPETFEPLRGSAVVLNVSDSSRSAPDALATYCITEGLTLLEASSDSVVVERLHMLAKRTHGPGRVVLGAGIFTGLSNLLARAVAKAVGSPESVQLGISSSPYSGAGKGTVTLMASALRAPVVRYEAGRRIETFGAGPGPRLDFAGELQPTIRAAFPEAFMLHESTSAPTVDVFFAPRPAPLVPAFRALPVWLVTSGLFGAYLQLMFGVLRRFVLSWRVSPVRLTATAKTADRAATMALVTADGMRAGGAAMAAMASLLAEKPPGAGVDFIDDALTLDDVLKRVERVAPGLVSRQPASATLPASHGSSRAEAKLG